MPASLNFRFKSANPNVHYAEGLLFRKSTISTNPKPKPKADSNPGPNPNPNSNLNHNLNPNVSTVARICTMDLRHSRPTE